MTSAEAFGLASATVIFTWSKLFERVRQVFPLFLECAMCVGFWVGLFGALFFVGVHDLPHRFLEACVVSVLAYSLSLLFRRLTA